MFKFKTIILLLAIIAICAADRGINRYKKKKYKYGLRHHHFLYYLTFLAVKLKIVFFLGTIFTIGLVAAKIVAILKISEYMKHKYHHVHEEKIVYSNPYEHHDHVHDWERSPGGYSFPSDFSVDHPPEDGYINHDRYGSAAAPSQYQTTGSTARDADGSLGSGIYNQFMRIAVYLRQSNLTDIALNDMGIEGENCKKKFICKADYNAQRNIILQTGFSILRDASYQKYKPNTTISSEDDCDELYQGCTQSSN